ncbi:E3 ubiquitin-protein ligase SH3RF1-like isoform X2 [Onthophagus taurus]|uniref:E3 ubiquitin-protein ligase SH3RF1-like isoform X2 n=1 Tax=Onthophagus taurus TaxID=166361 RepID=UPI000C209704|nr:E3 ubiquitin-protein ligase SH3RF1-like isoform X2 [Onthophagus taurus]
MDEGTLNDLLECSVCLERLDTSSKVLPCQHTFCKKCLEEIVDRHKELRCPECRILIHTKIDDLPPNVLLMRILEGMRNAAPKQKQQRNVKETHQNVQNLTPVHQINQGEHHRHKVNKPPVHNFLQPHQAYAKALYDYSSKEPGDLNFKHGDLIILRKRIDSNWYQGESGGKQGVFPISYVQIIHITPVPSHIPQCKALYDFRMTNDEEEGCLAFNKGDIINVIRRVDENWAEGKLDGKIGIFPLAFVELNSLARSLMKLSTNVQPGPSKVAPPTPTTEETSPLILTDHRRHTNVHSNQNVQQQHINQGLIQTQQVQVQQQPGAGIPASDSSLTVSSGSSSTTTPNTTSSNNSSSSSTAPSSPASPPPRNQVQTPRSNQKNDNNQLGTPQRQINPPPRPDHCHNREKRHSFTSLTPQHHPSNPHRHSAEILSPESSPNSQPPHQRRNVTESAPSSTSDSQLPAAYIALYPYKPQKQDELELKKGGIYMVTERCQDGWFKGTSNRTQKCGVFPGNYVALARGAPRSPQTAGRSDENKAVIVGLKGGVKSTSPRQQTSNLPPELPPRSASPACSTNNTISSSWHGQQDHAGAGLGRSSSAIMSSGVTAQNLSVSTSSSCVVKASEKSKDHRKEKSGTVSLMRRLTSIKRSKSPPPASYSMDNPVFEDSSLSTPNVHPVHVRSGSCPSQLLQQVQPVDHHRIYASTSSQRLKHKERPTVLTQSPRTTENPTGSSGSSPDIHHHRKSNSLDAGGGGNKTKTNSQNVRERVRCIAPYPPNTEYELELQVNDIIYVCKKRDDGWYKGTQQRTGRTGLFPASFVEALK